MYIISKFKIEKVIVLFSKKKLNWALQDLSYSLLTLSYADFAGSGVVHVLGGTCALVGCWFIGPRLAYSPLLS